jgi:putative hydrolase of the HAD superfamily
MFDSLSLSLQTGFVKPDKRAYLSAAQSLGLLPEECLFVDDREKYCKGARQVGMPAILYINVADFEQKLVQVLGRQYA